MDDFILFVKVGPERIENIPDNVKILDLVNEGLTMRHFEEIRKATSVMMGRVLNSPRDHLIIFSLIHLIRGDYPDVLLPLTTPNGELVYDLSEI
jgi:hypothetical protein